MGFPRRGKADYYAPGEHNVACFQCGRKFKSSQMFKHWQGYLVCRDHWEPRHPQDFVKAVREDVVIPNAQPQTDTFLHVCTALTCMAYADLGTADCMQVGNTPGQEVINGFGGETGLPPTAPPSVVAKEPGWMTDILDGTSTPLHANTGYGAYQDYIAPPGVTITNETYAGIEDYAGETIVWTPTWVPTVADPSPTVTPITNGRVEVYWDTIGGGWPVTSEGVLTLECTVNGTPALTAIEISFGDTGYGRFAWGPVP